MLTRIEVHSPSTPDPKLIEECLQSLAFPQMDARYHDVDRAAAGTCEWAFRHRAYRGWTASDRGMLWHKGKPGSGKSTLLKHLLDKSQNTLSNEHGGLILSFFFHGRGDELQRTPLARFKISSMLSSKGARKWGSRVWPGSGIKKSSGDSLSYHFLKFSRIAQGGYLSTPWTNVANRMPL